MWNCYVWPLDFSSNVKLWFVTTRCQWTPGYLIWIFQLTSELNNNSSHKLMWGHTWPSWALFLMTLPCHKLKFQQQYYIIHLLNMTPHEDEIAILEQLDVRNECEIVILCPLDVSSNCEIAILHHGISVSMWNFNSWHLDLSSNVKLPYVTSRCQWQCEITILEY